MPGGGGPARSLGTLIRSGRVDSEIQSGDLVDEHSPLQIIDFSGILRDPDVAIRFSDEQPIRNRRLAEPRHPVLLKSVRDDGNTTLHEGDHNVDQTRIDILRISGRKVIRAAHTARQLQPLQRIDLQQHIARLARQRQFQRFQGGIRQRSEVCPV